MTTYYEIEVGSAPSEESCAQVGEENYSKRSRKECAAYKSQILRHYPIPEDVDAGIRILVSPHEMGSYREVALTYSDEAGAAWAEQVESDTKCVLRKWDEISMQALGLQVA